MSIIDSEFLSKLESHPGEYAFRGQADASWKLESAATRRLRRQENAQWIQHADIYELSNDKVQSIYHDYHRDELVGPAKTFGFDIDDGIEITDLQILAELQHFGAATGLIDFTWSPLIALWFACEKAPNEDGKVFVVNLNDISIYESPSPSSKEEESLERLFPSDEGKSLSLYWEPKIRSEASARILRQHSVFVLPRSSVMKEGVQDIVIKAQHKKKIMDELAGMGISEQSLFLDIHGFSMTNRTNSPIRRMKSPISEDGVPHVYFMQGNKFYQQGDYVNAIKCYTQCINAMPEDFLVREPYYLRGNAKAAIGDYEGAIEDYDSADKGEIADMMSYRVSMKKNVIVNDLKWDRPWIFFNRGNANFELKEYKYALQDYDKAVEADMQLNSQSGHETIKFNRANTKVMLGNYDKAIEDYDEIINSKHEDSVYRKNALFNKSNALIIECQFDKALQCYREAFLSGYLGTEKKMKTLEKLVQHIGGTKYDHHIEPQSDGAICVVVEIKDGNKTDREFPFDGNIGNTGNFGGNRLPGGKGYSGAPPFKVIVKAMK